MKKVIVILSVLALAHVCLAFSDINISKGQKSFGFFLLPESGASMSSAFTADYGIDNEKGVEITYFSSGTYYLLSPIYQAGFHGKFKTDSFLGLNNILIAGIGLTQTAQSGASLPLDIGIIPYRFSNERTFVSCPGILSIFNDGVLINYFPSLTIKSPLGEVILGYKGIASITASSLRNRTLWAIGLRKTF